MDNLSELSHYWLIALTVIAFTAGYIDAVAGGGGMLNLPALLFAGVPPVSALAVNKITGISGTTLAVMKFALEKRIRWRTVFYAAIPCLVASYIGGKLALNASATVLAWAILICIPIALFIVLSDKPSQEKQPIEDSFPKTLLAITPLGFYDGILGPGTGTYMAIAARKVLKFDFLLATATIKPLNLLTNIGAAIAFLLAEKVIWTIAIPMLLASSVGGWLGSHSAIKGGDKFIRRLLVFVLVLMLAANLYKMIFIT
ncbi:MAG: TSUP family transporter [Cocleimonas sp.]|nr:TSUP family transporter [Cocleimonas sp.]